MFSPTASDTHHRKASTHQSIQRGRYPGHSQREVLPGRAGGPLAPPNVQTDGITQLPGEDSSHHLAPIHCAIHIMDTKCPDCPGKSQAAWMSPRLWPLSA